MKYHPDFDKEFNLNERMHSSNIDYLIGPVPIKGINIVLKREGETFEETFMSYLKYLCFYCLTIKDINHNEVNDDWERNLASLGTLAIPIISREGDWFYLKRGPLILDYYYLEEKRYWKFDEAGNIVIKDQEHTFSVGLIDANLRAIKGDYNSPKKEYKELYQLMKKDDSENKLEKYIDLIDEEELMETYECDGLLFTNYYSIDPIEKTINKPSNREIDYLIICPNSDVDDTDKFHRGYYHYGKETLADIDANHVYHSFRYDIFWIFLKKDHIHPAFLFYEGIKPEERHPRNWQNIINIWSQLDKNEEWLRDKRQSYLMILKNKNYLLN